ncbi:phosphoglycerate dehydrogenase [Candidatus Woesearchaeota archaeon]|nr:phosphoglycerate dehydrogenase [Candidatus Woesearchaeota archaeon]MBT6048126.1 phosphoglycerate dehydrogenase [Candidatus Scalindua sp.]
MKHKILISAPYMHAEKEKIEKMLESYSFDVDWAPVEERLEESNLLPIISKYEGILCGDDRITDKVIDAATELKAIVKWGTGIDSIDKGYAESKGIKVFRTPGAFSEPVSDTTLALMLSEVRGLSKNDSIVKSGRWEKPQGYMLREKTVGIIGFGDVGQAVAKKLIPFGVRVLVNDVRKFDEETLRSFNVSQVSKDEIYKTCDIISIHCDLNPTSKYVLNTDSFSKMEKQPYIINTARGPLIKEGDLVVALNKGLVSGVGIDVFEHEPLPKDSPLRSLDTVVASCHNSNSSPLCWDAVHKNSLKMMSEGLNNKQ